MDTTSPGSDISGNNNTFTASGTPTLAEDNVSNNFTQIPQLTSSKHLTNETVFSSKITNNSFITKK